MSEGRRAWRPPVPETARFLATFTVLAGVLMVAWHEVSPHYLGGLVAAVNWMLGVADVPLSINGAAGGRPGAHPELVGLVALFLATPRRPLAWRVRWLALGVGCIAALHAGLLGFDAWQVFRLQAEAGAGAPPETAAVARRWLPALCVAGAWLGAVAGVGPHDGWSSEPGDDDTDSSQ